MSHTNRIGKNVIYNIEGKLEKEIGCVSETERLLSFTVVPFFRRNF